jgi:hypothetical protein
VATVVVLEGHNKYVFERGSQPYIWSFK